MHGGKQGVTDMGQLFAAAASSKQVSIQGSSPAVLLGRTMPDSVGVADCAVTERAARRTKRVFQNTMLGKSIE
jgi:hypothetical protein